MDDLAINKGAGISGRKTAMDYALDAGNNLGEDAKAGKALVLPYLEENGKRFFVNRNRKPAAAAVGRQALGLLFGCC